MTLTQYFEETVKELEKLEFHKIVYQGYLEGLDIPEQIRVADDLMTMILKSCVLGMSLGLSPEVIARVLLEEGALVLSEGVTGVPGKRS